MGEIAESNFSNYEAYRQELGKEVSKVAESFVRIGYLLKVARDTDILKDSKYSDYLEFAAGEYGLDKTTVSRFININNRFSVGGNSNTILPQYSEYGRAQLQEMLMLPDAITEELNPSMTKAEIAEIKKEYQEEEKITDIEVLLEPIELPELTLFEKIIREYLRTDKEFYKKVFETCKGLADLPPEEYIRTLKETFIPNEEKIATVRISGTGRLLVHFENEKITATNMRSSEKAEYMWEQVLQGVCYSVNTEAETVPQSYKWAYGEEFEEKPEVAPVQLAQNVKNLPPQEAEKPLNAKCEVIQNEDIPAVETNNAQIVEKSVENVENLPSQETEKPLNAKCEVVSEDATEPALESTPEPTSEPALQQQAEEVSECEAEYAKMDVTTIIKELSMCATQMGIEVRHLNEPDEVSYRIKRAREEMEKFDMGLIELERRYK